MDLNNSFTIAGDVEEVWRFILAPENLAPCMPGAELVEVIDDRNWRGRVKVKFGPVALVFDGTIEVLEQDDLGHRLTLHGAGKDGRGRGAATTDVRVDLDAGVEPGTTLVSVVQDMTVSGQIAQFGRGMMADVTAAMTKQFAARLEAALLSQRTAPEGVLPAAAAGSATGAVTGDAGLTAVRTGRASPASAQASSDNAVSGFRMIWLVCVSLLKSLRNLVPGARGTRGSA